MNDPLSPQAPQAAPQPAGSPAPIPNHQPQIAPQAPQAPAAIIPQATPETLQTPSAPMAQEQVQPVPLTQNAAASPAPQSAPQPAPTPPTPPAPTVIANNDLQLSNSNRVVWLAVSLFIFLVFLLPETVTLINHYSGLGDGFSVYSNNFTLFGILFMTGYSLLRSPFYFILLAVITIIYLLKTRAVLNRLREKPELIEKYTKPLTPVHSFFSMVFSTPLGTIGATIVSMFIFPFTSLQLIFGGFDIISLGLFIAFASLLVYQLETFHKHYFMPLICTIGTPQFRLAPVVFSLWSPLLFILIGMISFLPGIMFVVVSIFNSGGIGY